MFIYFLQHSLLLERLGELHRRAIFRNPSNSYREASWLRLMPASLLFTPSQPPTFKTLSQMVKKLWRSSLRSPGTFWIAPSSSPRKAIWSLSRPTSWKQQILVKSGVNRFNRHIMGLSEFHDTPDGHCRCEISLICLCSRPFSYFAFW